MSGGPLREQCRGKWPALLRRFGVDGKFLEKKHGPCPCCGGKDRFRFDNAKGNGDWICNQCGAGDGFALLMKLKGWSFKEVAGEIEPIVGSVQATAQPARKMNDDWLKRVKNDLWQAGMRISANDPVGRYLASRGIALDEYPSALRYVERCRYEGKPPTYHPAMVARFVDPAGKPSTLHKTFLTMFGEKADVSQPKLLMPGDLAKGGAVRLAPAGPVLGVAEGIETALSASLLWRVPCWATLTGSSLMAWMPPEGVQKVIVFADNDANYKGHKVAFALANRLIEVQGLDVTVELPPDVGSDWNDALKADAA